MTADNALWWQTFWTAASAIATALAAMVAAVTAGIAVWVGKQPAKVTLEEIKRRDETASAAIAAILVRVCRAAEAVRVSSLDNESKLPSDKAVNSLRLRLREAIPRLEKFDGVWKDLSVKHHDTFLESQILLRKIDRDVSRWRGSWAKVDLRKMAMVMPRIDRRASALERVVSDLLRKE